MSNINRILQKKNNACSKFLTTFITFQQRRIWKIATIFKIAATGRLVFLFVGYVPDRTIVNTTFTFSQKHFYLISHYFNICNIQSIYRMCLKILLAEYFWANSDQQDGHFWVIVFIFTHTLPLQYYCPVFRKIKPL